MSNRIVQIACCGHENTRGTQSDMSLFALTEDGNLWWADNQSLTRVGHFPWTLIRGPGPIPSVGDAPTFSPQCSWCKGTLGTDTWTPLLLDGTFCSPDCVKEAEAFPRRKGDRKP